MASYQHRSGPREAKCSPLRRCGAAETAVSEVVGAILMFGIISLIFMVAMLGFVAAKESAQQRAAELQAESVAQRIAGSLLDAALFHEEHAGTTPDLEFQRALDMPAKIEGSDYTIDLQNDTVYVNVSMFGVSVQGSLLGANETAGFTICDQAPFIQDSTQLLVKVSSTQPVSDCWWTAKGQVAVTDPKVAYLRLS